MTHTGSGRLVQSTIRSLRILEYVEEQGSARLTDVATEFDIGHSTALNHLATLEHEGALVKRDGKYSLGMKFVKHGVSATQSIPYIEVVRRNVLELAEHLELETEFLVEEHGRVVSVIDTGYTFTRYPTADSNLNVGTYYPMSCTASGKAMLAAMSEERVEEIVEEWGLPQSTQYSITRREDLYEELAEIQERGYSRAKQEIVEGFDNIGAVITAPDGTIIGSITVGWPTYHFEETVPQQIIDELLDTKEAIETEIETTDA
ncbi:IclR family transcriptional regulator [Haloferax sp. DFSO52]|uniref:IclR family transcriptional regulator n=1 Tax=Haloferax sp. DFSO52 TaxID=3388505 RepID=UPI003A8636F3